MEQQTVVTSGFGKLNARDLLQGAVMAAIGAAAGAIIPLLDAWATGADVDWNFPLIWKISIATGVGHIIRKLLSPPVIVINNPTAQAVEAVKAKEATVEVKKTDTDKTMMEVDSANQKSSI